MMLPNANDYALFLYGCDITASNLYIPFVITGGGPTLLASLTQGNYTATQLATEIKRAMEVADIGHTYTVTIDRSINSGRSNRLTIATSGSHLDLLFSSDPNATNSVRDLIGFNHSDYTGATTYTGTTNIGSILIPDMITYDYLAPDAYVTNDGIRNVSASGVKETLVFAQMKFIQGQWKYITNFNGNTQETEWKAFLKYATRQLQFEIQPSINENPLEFYQVTLESTPEDGSGLAYKLKQMRGEGLYRFYDTGLLKFRVVIE